MGEGLLQPMHLFVVAFVALLIFGPKRLPELGRGVGDGIRALRRALRSSDEGGESVKKPNDITTKLPAD
jgi:sec-independent protein translocase protein TatA